MAEQETIERRTITEDSGERLATIETDTVSGVRHGDEEAGGAVDAKAKDGTVVVTREVRRSQHRH